MKWRLCAMLLLLAVLVIAVFTALRPSANTCSTVRDVNISLAVRTVPGRALLGMNTDTDHLNFGAVSPGITASRSMRIKHSRDASVEVGIEGVIEREVKGYLAEWVSITPSSFVLTEGEEQEVVFEAAIPIGAAPGNYTGRARFCVREE